MNDNIQQLPENLRRFVDPSLDRDMRLMAARGLVPIPPEDMAHVLSYLITDDDSEIVQEAEKSIQALPQNILERLLAGTSAPSQLLDYFSRNTDNEKYLEFAIINPRTPDSTIEYLAEHVHVQKLIDLISDNHQRILRSHEIVDALSRNPAISRSTLDKVISFVSLYLEKEIVVPERLQQNISDDMTQEDLLDAEQKIAEVSSSFLDKVELSEEFIEEKEIEEEEDLEEEQSVVYQNLLFAIKKMKLPEKLKLCLLGNAEARRILIKEPNRVVALAVLKNPKITEVEVNLAAQSTSVSEDILREIAKNREWARHYDIKYSLVTNPKSPPDISMNFLRHIRERDLREISRSKNVPGVIATAAKRIIQQKQESQKLKL